jgi:hypothetical protein
MAKGQGEKSVKRSNYNFAKSAVVATVIAVILLGFSIYAFAKLKDKDAQITNLQSQVASLQANMGQQDIRENGVAYDGIDGQNALNILEKLHQVEVKDFSYGKMVVAIDDVAADSAHFWQFDVNGQMAPSGADTYTTKTGEKITWKLTKLN